MTPEKWVARAKGEYAAVKAFGPKDSVFVGGSLVRPGTDSWFTDCLRLGLDEAVDAWDVHAYPKMPPQLEGTCSNSVNETELGVNTCYKRLGRKNPHPFWLGETGARSCHGIEARRWQAKMVAKMTACIVSRSDFEVIAFLWPWQCVSRSTPNDITTAHNPADAALYTVSALIDGFEYSRMNLGKGIQAATFGETTMLWSEQGEREVMLPLADNKPRLVVDVVGRTQPLRAKPGGASLTLTTSPIYILTEDAFNRLTAF